MLIFAKKNHVIIAVLNWGLVFKFLPLVRGLLRTILVWSHIKKELFL